MCEFYEASLIGEQENETIGEFYARIQDSVEAFKEIGISQDNTENFFEFNESGVVNKREDYESSLLESAVEATKEGTRTGAINEQAYMIKSIEKAKTQEQETQKYVEEQ